MRQYRIVSGPDHSGGVQYKIQSRSCGVFGWFWHDEKHVVGGIATRTTWHPTQPQAEKAVAELAHYWNSNSAVVKTYKCGCS